MTIENDVVDMSLSKKQLLGFVICVPQITLESWQLGFIANIKLLR